MSEPHPPPEKTELETVIDWRMIATGAGLGVAALAAAVVFLLLSGPRIAPAPEQALAPPRPAPAPRPSFVVFPRRSEPGAPPQVAAPPELLPPPAVEEPAPPPAHEPARVALAPPALVPAPPPVAAEPPVPKALSFKRMRPDGYGETQLAYLLDRQAKEADLDPKDDTPKKATVVKSGSQPPSAPAGTDVRPAPEVIAARGDLRGLPVRKESECRMGDQEAAVMGKIAELRTLRPLRRRGAQADESFGAVIQRDRELTDFLAKKKDWCDEAGVPALEQMLQAENAPVRVQLVAMLGSAKGEKASAALARRAVFDLAPEVREAAIKALRDRPRGEYRRVLLDGLRYPWAPPAEHAAEALVALNDRKSLSALSGLLDEPDPAAPVREAGKWVVTEVVRVNHLRNCLLCHAASSDKKDPIRALVPEKGQPLREVYYEGQRGTFVRADVVYLKQDFSLTQPVPDAHPWPTLQRFDYLIRKRELTEKEVEGLPPANDQKPPPDYAQRRAVLWALRELTGAQAGDRGADWRRVLIGWYFGAGL